MLEVIGGGRKERTNPHTARETVKTALGASLFVVKRAIFARSRMGTAQLSQHLSLLQQNI